MQNVLLFSHSLALGESENIRQKQRLELETGEGPHDEHADYSKRVKEATAVTQPL